MRDDQSAKSEIVLWDTATRRELRRIGSARRSIPGLDFSPDGKVLAASGSNQGVQFWDVASGREIRRIDGAASNGVLAFSPNGEMLVMTGAGRGLTLWDLAANRLHAEPEPEKFRVRSLALAPDGRTLAAGGMTFDEKGVEGEGQVRLYDLAHDPVARRAVLTLDSDVVGVGRPNERVTTCSDVAFTPDGRVVAVGMHKIRVWDAATADELDAFERGGGGGSDRLAVSPDGRWLAITSPFGAGINILDILPP